MKTILSHCAIFLLACVSTFGQIPAISQVKTDSIHLTTGISFTLHSKALGEDRNVMIGLPDGYEKSTKKYPVFYLLDGQWSFSFTKQTIDWVSRTRYGFMPEMILVSLNTGGDNRTRDLTPTQDRNNKTGGGADKLYQFIQEELIPFVDKNYRTYNYRVLGGTSFGGVFVMNAFHRDPQFFNGYISLSPSMWWDNNILLDRTKDQLIKNPTIHNRLYLSIANEGKGMGVDSLASILEKYAPNELKWKYDKLPEEVHETVSYKGYWDGLKFMFSDWQYPLVDFGTKEHLLSSNDSVTYGNVMHKTIKLTDDVLKSRSGLYVDSYGRTLALFKADNTLQLFSNRLPMLTLFPETQNTFFLNKAQIQKELYLRGFDIQFEFPKDDSLVVTANGKIDFTAKKVKCPPLVKLSGAILDKYVGTYSPPPQGNTFHIIKEGDLLKITDDPNSTYLYPIGENRFFAMVREAGYELEFVIGELNQVTKMKVIMNGNMVFESNKLN